MQDEEIRIACLNAVLAWTGSGNKLQDMQTFYEWVIAGRQKPQTLIVKKGQKVI